MWTRRPPTMGEREDAREVPFAADDGLMGVPADQVLLSTSPNLRSAALEEIGRHNTSPAEERLHSGWAFWFERCAGCRLPCAVRSGWSSVARGGMGWRVKGVCVCVRVCGRRCCWGGSEPESLWTRYG